MCSCWLEAGSNSVLPRPAVALSHTQSWIWPIARPTYLTDLVPAELKPDSVEASSSEQTVVSEDHSIPDKMNKSSVLVFLTCLAAARAQERLRVVTEDGKEYFVVTVPQASRANCLDIQDPAVCQATEQCSLVAFGAKSLCMKIERTDALYNVLAAGWNSSPRAASCASIGSEDLCHKSKDCDVYESPDDLLCAPVMSGEGKLTTQAIDDFEILLGRNDASADAQVGVEILASLGDDVVNSKVAGFAGWETDIDASLYQFARGTAKAGQTNSVGIGAAISRDEIEIGPEFKRELGSDVAFVVPAIRYRTKN